MQYQRGRRRGARWISRIPIVRTFGPLDRPPRGTVQLKFEELEALKLVDLEGMDQEQAAVTMGISRKSLWLDLKRARGKVTRALVTGMVIQIEGGSYMIRGNHALESERERTPGRAYGPPMERGSTEQK